MAFESINKVDLKRDERIDQLTEQLGIIQSPHIFRFSMDAVLLARFCRLPHRGRMLDLCSGNGVIPLLLSTRTALPITGLEIQRQLVDMGKRSVVMNGLEAQIQLCEGDLRQCPPDWYGQFDQITCNPPYMPVSDSERNRNTPMAIARHEICCTLEDVVQAAGRLVKSGGKLAMVHRAARFNDIVTAMRQHRLEPKRVRWVHPRLNTEANLVLVEATKDGGVELHVESPLVIYNDNGSYTDEVYRIYGGT